MTISIEPARYEIKIPCDPHARPELEAWIRLHPAHWIQPYRPRQVNSLYFDTAECTSLYENIDGVGDRTKLRLRWYKPTWTLQGPTRLELKRKQGMVGWKEISLPALDLNLEQQSWDEILTALRRALTDEGAVWFDRYRCPALINHYRRSYYATPDGDIRLTLDSELRAFDQRFSTRPNLRRTGILNEHIILELKAPADPAVYRRLAQILAHFPIRVDRHSKYVQGMLTAPDFDGFDLS